MSYMHIENLYRPTAQAILQFKTVFAMEKIHGTSAHVFWKDGKLGFFSGGESYTNFIALFNQEELAEKFREKFGDIQDVTIYGEAYGGKQQGMSETYGKQLRFIAFEVKVGELWLSVPQAHDCAALNLGFPFVHFSEIPTDMERIDAERDAPSVQAVRNGILEPKPREGVVLRPPFECTLNNGQRLIAKHKNEAFAERKTKIVDPDKAVVLAEASAIADEWVVAERLRHVIDRLTSERSEKEVSISDTGSIIKLMVEDVTREAEGEIVDSPAVRKAIGSAASTLFKQYLAKSLEGK